MSERPDSLESWEAQPNKELSSAELDALFKLDAKMESQKSNFAFISQFKSEADLIQFLHEQASAQAAKDVQLSAGQITGIKYIVTGTDSDAEILARLKAQFEHKGPTQFYQECYDRRFKKLQEKYAACQQYLDSQRIKQVIHDQSRSRRITWDKYQAEKAIVKETMALAKDLKRDEFKAYSDALSGYMEAYLIHKKTVADPAKTFDAFMALLPHVQLPSKPSPELDLLTAQQIVFEKYKQAQELEVTAPRKRPSTTGSVPTKRSKTDPSIAVPMVSEDLERPMEEESSPAQELPEQPYPPPVEEPPAEELPAEALPAEELSVAEPPTPEPPVEELLEPQPKLIHVPQSSLPVEPPPPLTSAETQEIIQEVSTHIVEEVKQEVAKKRAVRKSKKPIDVMTAPVPPSDTSSFPRLFQKSPEQVFSLFTQPTKSVFSVTKELPQTSIKEYITPPERTVSAPPPELLPPPTYQPPASPAINTDEYIMMPDPPQYQPEPLPPREDSKSIPVADVYMAQATEPPVRPPPDVERMSVDGDVRVAAVNQERINSINNFRLQSKELFITYPRCPISRQDLLDSIKNRYSSSPGRVLVNYLIVQEQHQTPTVTEGDPDAVTVPSDINAVTGLHLHCYFTFDKKFNTTNPRIFDVDGYHAHIEKVTRKPALIRYLLKEDKEPLCNFDYKSYLKEQVRKGHIKRKDYGEENALAMDTTKDIISLVQTGEISYTKAAITEQFRQWLERERARLSPRRSAFTFRIQQPWLPTSMHTAIRVEFPIKRETGYGILWLCGGTQTGKTYAANHQVDDDGQPMPVFSLHSSTDWSKYKYEQIILLNEFTGWMQPSEFIRATEQEYFAAKYAQAVKIPEEVLIVVTSNSSPRHIYRQYAADNPEQFEAFMNRIQLVLLTGANPRCHREPLRQITGPGAIWGKRILTIKERDALTPDMLALYESWSKERDSLVDREFKDIIEHVD